MFPEPSLFMLVLSGVGSSSDEMGLWRDNLKSYLYSNRKSLIVEDDHNDNDDSQKTVYFV